MCVKERKQTFIVDKEINLLDSIFDFKKDLSKKSIKSYIKNNSGLHHNEYYETFVNIVEEKKQNKQRVRR